MVEILDEMTEKEGLAFMEKIQTSPFAEGEAWHKVYLIPSGDKLMIVSKTDHAICDGLSMIHMWTLLQDGTPEEIWENRVRLPEKSEIDAASAQRVKDRYKRKLREYITNKIKEDSVLIDAKGKYDPIDRQIAISQTYKLQDLKAKSEKYGVTLNSYVSGVIMKATYDYSDGKEPSPCTIWLASSTRKAFNTFDEFTCDN